MDVLDEKFIKVCESYLEIGLKSIDILILAKVAEFNRNGCECYITTKRFVRMFGESDKTVRRSIDKLIKLNILTKRVERSDRKGSYGTDRILNVKPRNQWNVVSSKQEGDIDYGFTPGHNDHPTPVIMTTLPRS